MGRGALAGLTRLCYMITQPVGRPACQVSRGPLMNGRNMSRITSRHAAAATLINGAASGRGGGGGGEGDENEAAVVASGLEMDANRTPPTNGGRKEAAAPKERNEGEVTGNRSLAF